MDALAPPQNGPPPGASDNLRDRLEERLIADPLTTGYRPTLPSWAYSFEGWMPQLFLLRDIELMLTHPMVETALSYYKGGISHVEFQVDCEHEEIANYITEHIERFWDQGVPLLQGGYDYGWIGCENMYAIDPVGRLAWDHLIQFSPRDCFLLTQCAKPVGIRIKNVEDKGNVDLWLATADVPAKGLWYAHQPRFNLFYGRSQLHSAWRPWRRLAWKDGLEQVIDHGLYRHAFAGPVVRYPEEDYQSPAGTPATTLDSQGRPRRYARDVARQIAEWIKTGAGIGLSSAKYPHELGGDYKWDVEHPKHVLDVAPLIAAAKDLRDQISYGLGVPPELLQASETGSGYSGRSVVVEAFLTGQQRLANAMLWLFMRQVLKPLVCWNYGSSVQWNAKVLPLIETKNRAKNAQAGNEQPGQEQPAGRDQLADRQTPSPGQPGGQPGQPQIPGGGVGMPAEQGGAGFSHESLDRVRHIAERVLQRMRAS